MTAPPTGGHAKNPHTYTAVYVPTACPTSGTSGRAIDPSLAKTALTVLVGLALALPAALAACLLSLLSRMHNSVGLAPPTPQMIQEEEPQRACVLFRHLPVLCDKIAWRSLRAVTTPVHRCVMAAPSGSPVEFHVKREDLSSPLYGGNKVRTLQHQLAVIESRIAQGDARAADVTVVGSAGSNQVVATVVHGRGRLPPMTPVWLAKDSPDLDNTLNMLSTLSFPLAAQYNWGQPDPMFDHLQRTVFDDEGVVVTLGGNCPAGVFGQVGAALELAEQVSCPPSCCVVLWCGVLCCDVLCCVVLCCVVLCCVVLCCIVLCCVVLCCVVPKALLPKGKGRDVYPRVKVNGLGCVCCVRAVCKCVVA